MYPSLAIDCSDKLSLISISNGKDCWQRVGAEGRNQAKTIISTIEACLADARLEKDALKSLCWAAGPGSFTGLRIATSIAQGMSYALNIPLIAISSLELMAASAVTEIKNKTEGEVGKKEAGKKIKPGISMDSILAISDARMGELYWALFEIDHTKGVVVRKCPDSLSSIEKLFEFMQAQNFSTDTHIACIGSGAKLICSAQKAEFACRFVYIESECNAEAIFQIAESEVGQGNTLAAMQARPSYLRAKNAWKTLEQQ